MLSAKWLTHLLPAGHTIMIGLAWLPLVLLGLERAIRGGAGAVVGAGVAFALLILGTHPQWPLYGGVFAAFWTFGTAERTRRGVLRWLVCGVGAVAVAVPLTAVQLWPTWEAAGLSTRTGGVQASGSFVLALPTYLGMIGPSPTHDPPLTWETRGVFGACWLAAAIAAPVLVPGRTRWQVGVLLGLVFFALGGAVLVEWLPGFRMFRVPGRMLLVAAFPVAYLAGVTTDALVRAAWPADARQHLRRYLVLIGLALVLPALLFAWGGWRAQNSPDVWPAAILGWGAILLAFAVALWLVRADGRSPRFRTAVWVAALLAELLGPGLLLVEVRPFESIYPKGEAVAFLADRARPGAARVLDLGPEGGSVLGVGAPLALVYEVETLRGYNPLDVRHYREFVGFVEDDPGPVWGNTRLGQQVLPNLDVANPNLLDVMTVQFVACEPQQVPAGTWRAVATDPAPPWPVPRRPDMPDRLPPHVVLESQTALPRAWVVPEAAAMPAGDELAALKVCDFRKTVLLTTSDPLPFAPAAVPGPVATARVAEYRPNRVEVDLDGGGGFLVLADVWFPGWVCRVDGVEVPVYRANHAFRAVALPPDARRAVFSFEPRSYRVGRWVTLSALGLVVVAVLWRAAGFIPAVLARRPG
jgi:hypothetical protein